MDVEIARLIGSAGSGKTTALLNIMEKALDRLGNDPLRLGFASFTRAARKEAAERAADAWGVREATLSGEGWFRTVHSTCLRCLGVAKGQLLGGSKTDDQWIADALGVKISTTIDEDTGVPTYDGDPTVAAALRCWERARATLQPLADIARRERQADDNCPDIGEIVRIVDRYELAKRVDDRLDFSDLLSRFAGLRFDPTDGVSRCSPQGELPPVTAWMFDEQQDCSPLLDQVCKRLISAESVKWTWVVGDPFQCQPAGTPVLTTTGYKPIEDLDPETDKLIAYSRNEGVFYGTGGGVRFQKAFREVHSSRLVEVTFSDGTKLRCTRNHKWLVRTVAKPTFATYLMRKGNRWRVGTVQMFATHSPEFTAKVGDFRLKMRMNQEDADCAWVLRTFDTDRDARMYEQIVSCRFGLPQVTFRPVWGRTNLDREFIDGIFEELGDLDANGIRCLLAHNLEVAFPLCSKADRAKNGAKATRFVQAVNLLPGIHVVPKLLPGFFDRKKRGSGERRRSRSIGSEVSWVGVVSVAPVQSSGTTLVYSLDVEKHHTYVTRNGIVTGNSIYGFAGSNADCFVAWPASKERIMDRSYRCPKKILDLGERCLRRMHRGYFDRGVKAYGRDGEPRPDSDGSIVEVQAIEDLVARVDPTEDWLLIARTNFQARRLAAAMHEARKPVRWTKSSDEPTIRSVGLPALLALEKGEAISGAEWARAIQLLPCRDEKKQEVLTRGTKTRWKDPEVAKGMDVIFPDELPSVGASPALVEAIRSGSWCRLVDRGDEWRGMAKRYGPELAAEPRVRVGTVHSVKGAEARNVAVLTTTSKRVETASEDPEQWDEECRIAYVAVTRAKENLVIVNEGRNNTPRMEVL